VPGIDAIGGQVLDPSFETPRKCSNTNSVIVQLEDPFGYDRADIKVDAIVEDLRVCTAALPGPITPACAFANWEAQLTQSNALIDTTTTGGDKRVDRRVEKRLGHVHRLDIPDATIMELADRLTRKIECFDQHLLLSSRTKAFKPTKDRTRLFAYKAPRLQGFNYTHNSLLACCRFICRPFSDYGD
jgi:hypothetical protein